jgi:hypothetical protein
MQAGLHLGLHGNPITPVIAWPTLDAEGAGLTVPETFRWPQDARRRVNEFVFGHV